MLSNLALRNLDFISLIWYLIVVLAKKEKIIVFLVSWYKYLLIATPFCVFLSFSFLLLFAFQMLFPLLVSPLQTLPLPLPFASKKMLPHPSTHFCLTLLASPFPGATSLHRTKSLPSHWYQISSPLLHMLLEPWNTSNLIASSVSILWLICPEWGLGLSCFELYF